MKSRETFQIQQKSYVPLIWYVWISVDNIWNWDGLSFSILAGFTMMDSDWNVACTNAQTEHLTLEKTGHSVVFRVDLVNWVLI